MGMVIRAISLGPWARVASDPGLSQRSAPPQPEETCQIGKAGVKDTRQAPKIAFLWS